MILIDSNVFIIDRFFPNDSVYPQNRILIEKLPELEAAVSAFTLLEICGAISFRLSAKELDSWLLQFSAVYHVIVLDPFGLDSRTAVDWFQDFSVQVTAKIAKRMTFGDAVLLAEAESHRAQALITWNTKDFLRRTDVPVLTPSSFLKAR
jgi:hypothetical protein